MATRILDPKLLTLFAQTCEPLPDAEFIKVFLARWDRTRRARTRARICMIIIAVFAAVWVMPSVLVFTGSAMRFVGERTAPYAPMIVSPWGWAASTVVALAVIWRTGGRRRRR